MAQQPALEHVNMTVSDPDRTAQILTELFGWTIRWSGSSQLGGRSIHVGVPGNGTGYVALYAAGETKAPTESTYVSRGGLNHIGVVVDDIYLIEERVANAGYKPHMHGQDEPGRSYFYFDDHDGIEFEVVSYEARD